MLRVLGFYLLLLFGAPAHAQEPGHAPFQNPADPANVRMMAAFTELEKALDGLKPQADVIRADPSLSEEVRRERLLKLLSGEEARLQEFEAALANLVRRQGEFDGAPPEQTRLGIEITRQHIMTGIVDDFLTGETRRKVGLD